MVVCRYDEIPFWDGMKAMDRNDGWKPIGCSCPCVIPWSKKYSELGATKGRLVFTMGKFTAPLVYICTIYNRQLDRGRTSWDYYLYLVSKKEENKINSEAAHNAWGSPKFTWKYFLDSDLTDRGRGCWPPFVGDAVSGSLFNLLRSLKEIEAVIGASHAVTGVKENCKGGLLGVPHYLQMKPFVGAAL